ncbi:right-handed parallel beta-helix repeat-containing protein [Bythopirellula polymerisocia]|uniref:Right handed beta helix domain-containing protein n=1 Tax=Bythopirellula polymerisocia TaxID=2528003 RepID=A0A5C6CWS5_9BACT|nr:right-handed parallel beta-helix repeat-containing protein [Bythopirellula polymerisocia]TWU27871.1 hypothetical protein Pla144_26480 [Bythopirellula polymerisocia]
MKQSIHWLAVIGCSFSFWCTSDWVVAEEQAIGPQSTPVAREDFAHIWYVAQSTGSDSQGDGSQSKPWKSIEKALAEMPKASAEKRSAVLVAEGKYLCNALQLREYVELFGGFDSANWDRDIFLFQTILVSKDQCRILLGSNHARLDGFVLKGSQLRGEGAALYCKGTSPIVTNNRFQNNQTLAPLSWQPNYLHEKAHDGGAICALAGASPLISNNLFIENRTEIGRGAAIAFYSHCGGVISNNVFLGNRTGLSDQHRSSDGGAVSIFEWSKPRIENNLFIENQALAVNDGGALFVALWSSPSIERNVFVGNKSSDDGGALFIGGQEHRYDRPLDPLPDAEDFSILLSNNLFFGNANPKSNSGGIRMTMQSRARLVNNILGEKDQLYVQSSEVHLTNNTFLDTMTLIQFNAQLAPRLLANNIMWGKLKYEGETPIISSNVLGGFPGKGNMNTEPFLDQDLKKLTVLSADFDSCRFVTNLQIADADWEPNSLVGRVIESDRRWSVVKSNHANQVVVWGNQSHVAKVNLLPTYRLQSQSPCIDRGSDQHAPLTDIDGDRRPVGRSADIGADEFVPQ